MKVLKKWREWKTLENKKSVKTTPRKKRGCFINRVKKESMAKEITFVIRVIYEKHDDLIYQIFQHGKKKNYKYILDPRFSLHYKFRDLMKKLIMESDFIFDSKVDREDDVLIIWRNPENKEHDREEHFYTLAGFVAPTASCEFCRFKEEKDDLFFRCKLKEKDMVKELKNCSFFRQKDLFKT
jgi:hypothetical protein